ncbi:MAG: hypothetical protein HYU85_01195 [Chloroflexi bacterium]|nr:hypothetical protein [Chloroflexota bacterium]
MAGREIDWPGKSGKKYHYWIYDLGTKHDPVPANYVFTKETEQGTFRPIKGIKGIGYHNETSQLNITKKRLLN